MNWEYLRQIYQRYFTFSRSERYGVIVLCSIILILILLSYLIPLFDKPETYDSTEFRRIIQEMEEQKSNPVEVKSGRLFSFNPNSITKEELDSLPLPGNVKNNILKYREKGGVFKDKESFRRIYGMNDSIYICFEPYLIIDKIIEEKATESAHTQIETRDSMFFFDPNTASDSDLVMLGLKAWQAGNIIKYREKGGKFRTESDLAKIYGIDSALYKSVLPWIKIPELKDAAATQAQKDPAKLIIELNSADSVILVSLPGIGPVMASRIIKYRQALGGFYSSTQLLEIYGMKPETYELIRSKVEADTNLIQKISINFAEYDELAKHPYITGAEAKNIIKHRNKSGSFETCSELESKKVIEGATYIKVRPYLKVD
jgi:DNA uptake protein ComE-like DNA-binding protein